MTTKNCPNCGAPYDHEVNKCPYCGTIYFDMSIIDMDNKEPIFLKIRLRDCYITQKVIPQAAVFTEEPQEIPVYYLGSTVRSYFVPPRLINTELSFISCCQIDGRSTIIERIDND